MTEWTADLEVPDPDLMDVLRAGQLLDRAAEDASYRDLVADSLIEDVELDRVDWFE